MSDTTDGDLKQRARSVRRAGPTAEQVEAFRKQQEAKDRAPRSITTECAFADGVDPMIYGPYLPISADEVDVFNDILSDEIDSDFSSSLCCCDFCYDDFVRSWPGTAFREAEFQEQSMESRWLAEETRVPTIYTTTEMSTLRQLVQCPKCLEYGALNVWIYEHRFSDVDDLERDIDALLAIGRRTPFLLLQHPLAVRILDEIGTLHAAGAPTLCDMPLFRARTAESVNALGQDPSALETYGPAPAHVTVEGRFNHAGSPMLYLADSAATAACELGRPGEPCFVGAVHLKAPWRVLDLVDLEEDDLMKAVASSALVAAPNTGAGWVKREYIFSRFVADCAKSVGFDAIRYGSTRKWDRSNYVLLSIPEDLPSLMELDGMEPLVCPDPDRRW